MRRSAAIPGEECHVALFVPALPLSFSPWGWRCLRLPPTPTPRPVIPIVLVHGLLGFDSLPASMTTFYGLPGELRSAAPRSMSPMSRQQLFRGPWRTS